MKKAQITAMASCGALMATSIEKSVWMSGGIGI